MSSPRLPYGRQWIDADDVAAVTAAVESDFLTQGPAVAEFELALAAACDAPYAVALSSGTAALHLAAVAAGLGPGDLLVTSPITFVASANCAVYCGADVGLVDIDPVTRNLSPTGLARFLDGEPRTKAIVAVDYAGLPADLPALSRLARAHGALLIEDACHALGARYRDESGQLRTVGCGAHADMTVFSFHPVKHITTGEGGAITTRSKELYERLLRLRSHGIERDPARLEEHHGPWYYEMQELGWNYRITDLQCVLGRSQLRRLEGFVARRRAIAELYRAGFAGVPGIVTPVEPEGLRSSYHLYPLWFDEALLGRSRRTIFEALQERGLGVQVHYVPVHLQPFYRRRLQLRPGQLAEAERFYHGAISIPMYPKLDDADVARVVRTVREVVAT